MPAAREAARPAANAIWWLYDEQRRQPLGPFTPAEIRARVNDGGITAQTRIRRNDTGWVAAGTVTGLLPAPPPPPPPPKPARADAIWIYWSEARQTEVGPLTSAEMLQAARSGEIHPDEDQVRQLDGDWAKARSVRGLFPPAPPPRAAPMAVQARIAVEPEPWVPPVPAPDEADAQDTVRDTAPPMRPADASDGIDAQDTVRDRTPPALQRNLVRPAEAVVVEPPEFQPPAAGLWHWRNDITHAVVGPIAWAAMREAVELGAVSPETLVRLDGGPWKPAADCDGLFNDGEPDLGDDASGADAPAVAPRLPPSPFDDDTEP